MGLDDSVLNVHLFPVSPIHVCNFKLFEARSGVSNQVLFHLPPEPSTDVSADT